jgi:hypothetical protein
LAPNPETLWGTLYYVLPRQKKTKVKKYVYVIGWSDAINHDRGGSAGREDATRGSKHRGLEHAHEKRKHARFVAIAPNSRQVLIRDV